MSLTILQINAAEIRPKDYKLYDGKGLYLLVTKKGSKSWRQKYRYGDREKVLSHGLYPDTSLKMARELTLEARQTLKAGLDPSTQKKLLKEQAKNSSQEYFKSVASEWLNVKEATWANSHTSKVRGRLDKYIYPKIASRPVSEIKPLEVLDLLKEIEKTGKHETTKRIKQLIGQVMRYAVATGKAESDPTAFLAGTLINPTKSHFAAITTPNEAARLMAAIDVYEGTNIVCAALRLSALFFCRPGELRKLEWGDVDFEREIIEIPSERMKMRADHIIPLSSQALEILNQLKNCSNGGKFILPSARGPSRPLSENGVRTALRTLGFTNSEMTAHGFRAMARTLLDEVLEIRVEYIEQQLAHAVKDSNGTAYNRTKYLVQRKDMMQKWADYLDQLKASYLSKKNHQGVFA